ncbi:MAG: hypothetical protein JO089_03045 [Alphaproteobacteria bacterium]|nr:hypothetical protein [Alphaproteobacteria bacterium]
MKRFCAPREIRPAHPHAFTIKIGLITYKGSKAEVRDDGLYLAPPLHYRLGLRPLLIPWNQIALSHDRAGNVAEDALHLHKEFGFFSHKFTIGHPSATELWCPQELSSLIFTKIAHLPRLSGRAV